MSNLRLVTGQTINAEGKAARKKIGRRALTLSVEPGTKCGKGFSEKRRRTPHKTHAGLRVHPLPYGAKWYQRGRYAR